MELVRQRQQLARRQCFRSVALEIKTGTYSKLTILHLEVALDIFTVLLQTKTLHVLRHWSPRGPISGKVAPSSGIRWIKNVISDGLWSFCFCLYRRSPANPF
mmetsp:Transcript_103147/g.330706  ORF Transcript_103147/g.330706 Transcript_103147/m.330706 type:complete len:102 (+) Transcript_103147:187-492(+)